MEEPPPATQEFLRREALDALHRCGNVRKNMCDDVVGEFAHLLETEFGYTMHAPIRAPFKTDQGQKKHFVALIPANETRFASGTGYVVIDPTVRQFEAAVDRPLPAVAIIPPTDTRQTEWYASIDIP